MSQIVIDLKKGARINLAKKAPTLKRVRLELGWEPNTTSTGTTHDLDVTTFGLSDHRAADGTVTRTIRSQDYVVFYGNKQSLDGALVHSGDNLTGAGSSDVKEFVVVDLTTIAADIAELSVIVTIHDAIARKQNFGQISKSFIRLVNDETNEVVAKSDLEEDFSVETALQFGSLYRNEDGEWVFKLIGTGYEQGLDAFVRIYGGTPT